MPRILTPLLLVALAAPALAAPVELPGAVERIEVRQDGGIGVQISQQGNRLIVLRVLPDGAAAKVGIRAWDEIVQIEKRWFKGMNFEIALTMIRGEPGTQLNLHVQRRSVPEPIKMVLTRRMLPVQE